MKTRKYIFVVGGVISGVGKGITTSSIGKILQSHGYKVTAMKIDPYVNVDAGTMNPTEHGEVFVLKDGDETDQDMGNYERFLGTSLSRDNYMTTGRVYLSVIEKERALAYKGKCVQVVPHIPYEVIDRINHAVDKAGAEIVVIEVGGTVGEYENILFLETARMLKIKNPDDVLFAIVSYLPTPSTVGEMKTKPTQHAVRALNSAGIQPDFIVARSDIALDVKRKEKLALFCNVTPESVISAPDVESIYEVPGNFEKDKLGDMILKRLKLKSRGTSEKWREWEGFVRKARNVKNEVRIAVVGKYFDTGDYVLADSYLSIIEALKYSAISQGKKAKLVWLSATTFEGKNPPIAELIGFDGILVPGGFGSRGVEGKLNVIRFAREHKIPYFGICYGMQLAVIEYARNVLGYKDATSREIDLKSKHLIIDIMEGQKENMEKGNMGGSMRLGAYPAVLQKGSIARTAYGEDKIVERHRHRFEVNPEYVDALEAKGLVFSGKSPDGKLMEIAELPTSVHPFFLGTQFHPEFEARPLRPHPIFTAFIKTAVNRAKGK
ncbi:MAG: CTP synthetase [Candidatus Yonathbacteria bacterium CG10_big_fil_rev_8_21_14_0_10_43_136]|uniref:CTP synthase n=2 Tax=Parcubacteria group TaxID=1794811 RepID=A0A2M7Q5S8_9BACT|nr:MAG: CTP synthase [Candidatus Nomurabacteria bacterium CG2_30_43_9]PIR40583.1 MAG: CTP synthetase [Candidatus Yonathbacteria bacterium CG10_big_fil_rev_8_21_14_0_10_43_136]PIX56980.1 MAG: CTP synthase [Candidatus Yonathbacteria bacterium CG_4_10_14_3_um_filter_43_12]PIY58420.1 MAG: CTP synthase [Candidatus Yonathbacteria bacterium CG_4_10_14_0_8_um_filter_43_17]PJC22138.1 MAG: CTP synthase [Candidatus Yonathbacteria bacterium CG_4_9_14_0_2_um_filter_43_16]